MYACTHTHVLPVEQPRSRFIFRDPSDRALWLSADSAHFLPTQSLYMACQTHMEDTGVALPITKIAGPQIDTQSVTMRLVIMYTSLSHVCT